MDHKANEDSYRFLEYNKAAFDVHLRSVPGETEKELIRSLQTGFFDRTVYPDASFAPKLLTNDADRHENVLTALVREMETCDRLDLSVAFLAASGIQVLMQSLIDMRERGVPVRLLSSTYLSFNNPDAIAKLKEFDNIHLKIFDGHLHTKGYIFSHGNMRSVIVGSSNLTQSALLTNEEWNLQVTTYASGEVWKAAHDEFERVWNSSQAVEATDEWIERYRKQYERQARRKTFISWDTSDGHGSYQPVRMEYDVIRPNKMQEEALKNLKALHARGERRALLISATGTGKTYLSALDAKQCDAKRVLFVVHRLRIAEDACKSFQRVMGNTRTFGIYSRERREVDRDYVFSTIQLLERHLDDFCPHDFDYIVIDEAHRAGADSYQKVMKYFQPIFMLGMTATPERTDGFNIYDLFDNNIAYRITLQKAQESELLVPFHYFGITDLNVDGEEIEDVSDFSLLVSQERVNHVIDQIERYSVESERRGLIFCSTVKEACRLSEEFNKRGYRTCALSGDSTEAERAHAIERLECDRTKRDDWLEYIFTRDIFNEGIDIPSVNQIIMLRPTESAIIFVQQLGRGLRLKKGKDYTLVLDFIGNYQKSFLIPIALSGDKSYNKDNLRRYMREGSRLMPGCSTINFDKVSEKRVYRMLDAARFGGTTLIKQEYLSLKNMLGRIPSLMDFCVNGSIDPELIFANKSLGSYHAFLAKYEKKDYKVVFTDAQDQMLKFVSQKIAFGKRPQELLLLKLLMAQSSVCDAEFRTAVSRESSSLPIAACNIKNVLGGAFLTGAQANTFSACKFLAWENGEYVPSREFAAALKDDEFRRQMEEVVDFGLMRFHERYADNYRNTNLVLYRKYTYEDVCRLLDWDKNLSGQNIGGYKYDKHTNTFPVFINYEKGEDVAASIRYHDRFLSPSRLIAISKQPRYLNSPEIERLKNIEDNGMTVYLFVRKNKDDAESKEFYFLGEMFPTGEYRAITMAGTTKPAVEIGYRLETAVPDELYDYLTSGEQ